ncbi:MAG: transglutaminase domain-containing protein [Desulfuromonadaceae bacterium]|nr:transglutaminase domain-containing protein [Desulfuromonadaceae bacterium]MDD5107653.1 transglutaminase domain-containing protein [Desulfuromonadaceae bacterium]
MFRTHSRIIAAIVMFFFTWTSGGVFSIAHAAVDAAKKDKAQEQRQKKAEGPEERFSKITEEMESTLADTKADVGSKKARLKAGRDEINKLDVEMRGQFAETEKKLKDAKLPAEILERHRKFVKHYDDNLNELKRNIERVEKAKNNAEAETELRKVHDHLKRVKAPSRHQKLDPNNLPHRQPKAQKREPRMKKEEFDRDLKKDKHAWKSAKRIQVAASGSVAGLLTADDLAETVEVQFTPEIKAKALELGNNPVKIYEWVRNNIEFVPTWGSIQGAQMTLLTKQGNAFDTASLLIALLRAAGISARYATGTVELPIDKVMNWAGGFTDPNAALNFMASGGVPITGLRSGGKVVAARLEHVWVKAWIDYIPSRGAVHKEGDTWIPLDGSFKKYNYSDGVDFKTAVPFDGQGFAAQLRAAAIVNDQEGYVTNVSSSTIQTTLSDYNTRLENYVAQNLPNATAADILGKKDIIRKEQPILPASLPYKVVVTGVEASEVPASYRHNIKFDIPGTPNIDEYGELLATTGLSFSASLPQLAGKRVIVSFDPATPADKAIIDSYVAQQATTLPAYLIQVVPTVRIDNVVVATGPPVGMGIEQPLTISISALNSSQLVTHNLYAGDYAAIGLNPSKIALDVLQNRIDKNDFSDPVGEMLHQTTLSYWGEVDAFNDVIAKTIGVRNLRHPSELAATAKISLSWLWGLRAYGTYKSRNIDVKLDNQSVMAKVIDSTKEYAYMQQSGANSSFLEGAVFDQLFGKNIGDSISAVNAMKLANDQGIPIYGIDANNVAATLPKLQVSQEIRDEVANAVNAGLVVQIPKTNISHLGWNGIGYIITNPVDGTAAYRISGGLNGGDSPTEQAFVQPTPKLPAIGISAWLVSIMASNMGLKLKMAGGFIMGITSAAPVSIPVPMGNPWALLCALLLGLIVAAVKQAVDTANNNKRDNWVVLRHYTKMETVELILAETLQDLSGFFLYRLYGSAGGECPVADGGPYLTNDVFINPLFEIDRIKISTILGIKDPPPNNDPREVTSFIDLRINTTDYPNYLSEFNVCNFRGGTQLHHKGTLYFGSPNSYQQYRLVP